MTDPQIPPPVTARMTALESSLAPLFAKFPHLPVHIRQTLAGFAPWLALIGGILGLLSFVPALFSLLFVSAALPFAPMMGGWYPMIIISLICTGISSVLSLLAFKPLSTRRKQGWNLLFYSTTVNAAAAILSLIFGSGAIGGIIGAVIGYWLLFEVRELYR